MAMLGKPVLLGSRALYEYGAQFLTVRSKESLPGILESCLRASANKEIQREAFRMAYYYIFKFELPFSAVTVLGIHDAKLNYIDREDLALGKDDSLDHICNFLIKGNPLFDCPSVEQRSRTTADEDAFFEELAHSPDYLRNVRYERWLRLQSLSRSLKALLQRLPFGIGRALLNMGRGRWRAFLIWVERKA
jgi:hypothetical protein